MKNYGFIKVAAGVVSVHPANPEANAQQLEKMIFQAAREGVRVLTFPELSLTGYTCADLFLTPLLQQKAQSALASLLKKTEKADIIFIVGLPVAAGASLLNAAAVCYRGEILGVVPKSYLPNYREFQEPRWFTSALVWNGTEVTLAGQTVAAGTDLLFKAGGCTFGVEICEDAWAVVPPSSQACLQGADIIFNLSASNELVGIVCWHSNRPDVYADTCMLRADLGSPPPMWCLHPMRLFTRTEFCLHSPNGLILECS